MKQKFAKPASNDLFVSCNVRLAQVVGPNAAIVHEKIAYCINENRRNGRHLIDGRTWTHLTHKQLAEKLQMMTAREVGYAIEKLVEHHLVITGNYNTWGADRTTWYTIDDAIMTTFYASYFAPKMTETNLQNGLTNLQIGQTKLQNERLQNCKSDNSIIPQYNTNSTQPNYSTKQEDDFLMTSDDDENGDESVSSTASPVANDGDDPQVGVFDRPTWRKWKKILPDGKFDSDRAEQLKELLDRFGEDKVKEFINYVKGYVNGVSLATFLEKVREQLIMSYYEEKRKNNPFVR